MRSLSAVAVFAGAMLVAASPSTSGVAQEPVIDTSNWISLTAGDAFKLRVPTGTTFKTDQGIDSFVSGFINPQFEMMFDYGPYSNTLAEMRADPDYKVDDIIIDGRKGLLVTGPGKNAWGCKDLVTAAYVVVAHKPGMWGDTRLEISGCTKSPEVISTLHEIFRTITFMHH